MSVELPPDELEACHAVIRAHARSFYLASHLLPVGVRQGSYAMYAFCRHADDAIDLGGPEGQARRLELLRERLGRIYEGRPEGPIDRAFQRVVQRAEIPRALPEALLAGLAMDCDGPRFESERELTRYAFRVASTVGLMMTLLMGVRHPEAWLRAAHLGVGMQLTNIARDVGEDARRGRIYLPASLMEEAGLAPEVLATASRAPAACQEAVRRLLARAAAHYRAAESGIALLPRECRLAIAASRYLYAAIGDELARRGHDPLAGRARVSLPRQLALLGRAAWRAQVPASPAPGPDEGLLLAMIAEAGLVHEAVTFFPRRVAWVEDR